MIDIPTCYSSAFHTDQGGISKSELNNPVMVSTPSIHRICSVKPV